MAEYYELTKIEDKDTSGMIMTAAIISCGLCGEMIDGMGGPGHGAICTTCAGKIFRGELKGLVKRG